MGYTHYWDRKRVLPQPQFLLAVEDCRRICQTLAIPLGDADGQDQPAFNANGICFNGHADSGHLTSFQKVQEIIWPKVAARGIAVVGEADAVAGAWGAGPSVNARVLGPSGDGSYETFRVERAWDGGCRGEQGQGGWWYDYCKTNYRPYDLCVQCCLLILSHHLGKELFRVSSDGTSAQWNDARDACQHVLGFGMDWGEGELSPVLAAGGGAA